MVGAFVIDDTGSPGRKSNSHFLKEDRKTWCGLLLTPTQRKYAEQEMAACISVIQSEFDISELHFSDIYNKKGDWIGVKPEERIGIFQAFAKIFSHEQFPLMCRTFNKTSLRDNGIIVYGNGVLDGFDLNRHEDAALYFLLLDLKLLVKTENFLTPIDIIIDEGRKRAGYLEKHNILDGLATQSSLRYASSAANVLLQIVDFAAFCLNRYQILLCKQSKTDFDVEFLQVLSSANFNFLNLEKWDLSVNQLQSVNVDDYDYFLWLKYADDGFFDRKRFVENLLNITS
jgi:hypothetical protein